MEKQKKSVFKKWWFWLLIIIILAGIGVGLFFALRDTDADDDDDDEDTKVSDDKAKCEYEYDDEEVTISFPDNDIDKISEEYKLGSSYIKIGNKKIYNSKSKAEKEAEESEKTDDKEEETNNSESESSSEPSYSNKSKYGLGETFKFSDLEITIGSNYSFTKVDNKYSDKNGKTVVKMPITVKNVKDENNHLNMFYYKVFGSAGTEVDTAGSYFKDPVDYAGDLRPGASCTKYLYFIYDGDGEYAIEFDNYSQKLEVVFEIKKAQ